MAGPLKLVARPIRYRRRQHHAIENNPDCGALIAAGTVFGWLTASGRLVSAVELSFKAKTLADATGHREKLAAFVRDQGWLFERDVLKTAMILDRYSRQREQWLFNYANGSNTLTPAFLKSF